MSMPRKIIRADRKSNVPLCAAVQEGDLAEVRRLIEEEKVDVNQRDSSGKTALFFAAVDDPKLLDILLANGAEVNIIDDEPGHTPFVTAVRAERIASVKTLLAHGADPNMIVGPTRTCALMCVLSQDQPNVALLDLLLGKRTFVEQLLNIKPCPPPTMEILNAAINFARQQDEFIHGFRPIIKKLEAYRNKHYVQDEAQEFGYRPRPPSMLATIASAVINVITYPFRMLAQGINAMFGGPAAMPTLRSVMPKTQAEPKVPVAEQMNELRGMLTRHFDMVCAVLLTEAANASDKPLLQKRHLVEEAVIYSDMRDRIKAENDPNVFCQMVEKYLSHFDLVLMAQKATPSFVGDFTKEIPETPEDNPAVANRRKSVVFTKLSPEIEKEVLELGSKFEMLKRSI